MLAALFYRLENDLARFDTESFGQYWCSITIDAKILGFYARENYDIFDILVIKNL